MPRDTLKPSFSMYINDLAVPDEILRFIQDIEVDLTFGMADQIKLKISNPSISEYGVGYAEGKFAFIDSKAFLPGNQIDILMGWGDDQVHVGSGIIQKWLPNFPEDGMPSLDILALDASVKLMDGEESKEPRSYPNFDFDTIVDEIINRYGILPGTIDATPSTGRENLIKKRGMSDYDFIKAISNITGKLFKIYYDLPSKQWKADWVDFTEANQSLKLHFEYGGQFATCLSFEPEFGLRNSPNEVKLMYFEKATGTFEEIVVGKREPGEDLKLTKAETTEFFDGQVISQPILSMSKLRVAAGDVSVEIVPDRKFENQELAQKWAESWLKQRRDNFITGQGTCIGIETLKPGETHEIKGIGVLLSGDWEFRTVRHKFGYGGYRCDFSAHKIIEE